MCQPGYIALVEATRAIPMGRFWERNPQLENLWPEFVPDGYDVQHNLIGHGLIPGAASVINGEVLFELIRRRPLRRITRELGIRRSVSHCAPPPRYPDRPIQIDNLIDIQLHTYQAVLFPAEVQLEIGREFGRFLWDVDGKLRRVYKSFDHRLIKDLKEDFAHLFALTTLNWTYDLRQLHRIDSTLTLLQRSNVVRRVVTQWS